MSNDMTPSPDDLARDAVKDMEVCEGATPGPWMWRPDSDLFVDSKYIMRASLRGSPANLRVCAIDMILLVDAVFFTMSRTALPAWIRRAVAAEAKLKEVQQAAQPLFAFHDESRKWFLPGERDSLLATIGEIKAILTLEGAKDE